MGVSADYLSVLRSELVKLNRRYGGQLALISQSQRALEAAVDGKMLAMARAAEARVARQIAAGAETKQAIWEIEEALKSAESPQKDLLVVSPEASPDSLTASVVSARKR